MVDSAFTFVKDVVRRIECCKETGNPQEAETIWDEFEDVAEPWEIAQAKEMLGR